MLHWHFLKSTGDMGTPRQGPHEGIQSNSAHEQHVLCNMHTTDEGSNSAFSKEPEVGSITFK